MSKAVGFLGVGAFLPEQVRGNDWWSPEIVDGWTRSALDNRERVEASLRDSKTEGERRVLAAMLAGNHDPFRGVVERHVMPAGMLPSDMEIAAARAALDRSGIDVVDIDLLLTHSLAPDELMVPNAFAVHEALGLPERCFTTTVEGTCNAFLLQASLATAMISDGRARHALLVQSCGLSPLLRREDPQSAWFGDGATAVVLGAVADGFGVLGCSHHTDSSLRRAIKTGVPGRAWYDEGRAWFYAADRGEAYRILLGFVDQGKQGLHEALADAGLSASAIDFFACHQAQPWQQREIQEFAELSQARSLDTFALTGNLAGANIPFILARADKEGLLRSGDVVAMFGGGAGITWSGLIARWGRA